MARPRQWRPQPPPNPIRPAYERMAERLYRAHATRISGGKPIVEWNPNAEWAEDWLNLGREALEEWRD